MPEGETGNPVSPSTLPKTVTIPHDPFVSLPVKQYRSYFPGGGISCYSTSNPSIENCILWGNSSPNSQEIFLDETSQIAVSYSNMDSAWPGAGNINANPQFVNAANADYHLLPISLCIDSGNPFFVPDPGEIDIDGQPRVIGGRVDMGADEYYVYRAF